jgi:lipoate-protein ligase A
VNHPSVVIGRFQDPNREADLKLCQEQQVTVARRFTGGGTVYHDEGNLNFTVLQRRQAESLMSIHRRNSSIIIDALRQFGVQSKFVSPNSVHVADRKISGGAAASSSRVSLWHASILISTNTERLNQLLAPSRHRTHSNLIRSKSHPVTTLNENSPNPVGVDEFTLQLLDSARRAFEVELQDGDVSEDERKLARTLCDQKYSDSHWNLEGHVSRLKEKMEGVHTTIAV